MFNGYRAEFAPQILADTCPEARVECAGAVAGFRGSFAIEIRLKGASVLHPTKGAGANPDRQFGISRAGRVSACASCRVSSCRVLWQETERGVVWQGNRRLFDGLRRKSQPDGMDGTSTRRALPTDLQQTHPVFKPRRIRAGRVRAPGLICRPQQVRRRSTLISGPFSRRTQLPRSSQISEWCSTAWAIPAA